MRMFLLLILFVPSVSVASPTKIRLGTEWVLPYTGMNEKKQPTGYVFDILEDIAKKYNYKFEYIEIPASRQVLSVQKDEIDYAILPIYLIRYLPSVEMISTAFGVSYAGVLTMGNHRMESLTDLSVLSGKTVVMSYMGPETETFREMVLAESGENKPEILEVSGTDTAKRMLLMMKSKRADLGIGDYYVLRYAAMQSKGEKIHVIPASFAGFGAVIMFSRKNKPGLEKLDRDIREWFESARRSGRLKKILKKYNLEDWSNLLPY